MSEKHLHKIEIKPLSVNLAWQGKRFKTPAYKKYERDLMFILPKITLPIKPFKIEFVFGFSNSLSDIDNPVKLILDVLQKKYLFNDRDIFELNVKKEIVKKGCEFFSFKINSYLK